MGLSKFTFHNAQKMVAMQYNDQALRICGKRGILPVARPRGGLELSQHFTFLFLLKGLKKEMCLHGGRTETDAPSRCSLG
jgi:hypothetical protein